jgi:large subunit ribosomal protein L29
MKAADLREKSVDDLRELEKTLARDVFQNRLKNFTNRLDDTSAIRKSRRDLARVVTLLRERDRGIVRAPAAAKAAPAAKATPAPKAAPAAKAEVKAADSAPAKAKKTAAKKSTTKASKKGEAK